MSTLEEHDAEQAAITAMCEAGTCDHPECHEDDTCRTCGEQYDDGGDGYDDECPSCADRSYMNEIVLRSAPRWAWEIMDETLEMDAASKAFSADLRKGIFRSLTAMAIACEQLSDEPIAPEDCDAE